MEQYTEKQYDDDLTVVADEYNDSFQTDNVDLFEFPSYDESPIARLKSLVLSIDWEITDDILRQFNEELVDLKDIWADEKIYLVYIQALEKISKYIYQEKADANPNAIKLLLTFYYNLEKIISSEDMPEDEKKQILIDDVRKFEKLKQQIGRAARPERRTPALEPVEEPEAGPEVFDASDKEDILFDLKAIVLGIDWEITEKDLGKLRDEVIRLEEVFAGSRPKLIFLQGIGTLGAYINLKKSNAHPDAFKLLHAFLAGLEKIVPTPLSIEEEKAILFPEVEKFNAFKAVVGSTIAPQAVQDVAEEDLDEYDEEYGEEGGGIAPAFSDLPEGETRGFQEEEEAAALGISSTLNVASQIDMFFSEEAQAEQLEVGEAETSPLIEREPGDEFRDAAEAQLDTLFQADFAEDGSLAVPHVDQATALRGVDVETEADDDSGEADLPFEAGQLAPALADIGDEGSRGVKTFAQIEEQEELFGEYEDRLDDIFAEPAERVEEEALSVPPSVDEAAGFEVATAKALAAESLTGEPEVMLGVSVEAEDEDVTGEEVLVNLDEGPVAALSGEGDADFDREIRVISEDTEELSFAPDTPISTLSGDLQEEEGFVELPGADVEAEAALEDQLESFFALEDAEEETSLESRDETSEQEMAEVGLFVESAGPVTEEIRDIEVLEEEQPPMEAAVEPEAVFEVEEPIASSLFVQEVLGEEIVEEAEVESLRAQSLEPEEEVVVFELVEEEEEDIFSSFDDEEPLFSGERESEMREKEAEVLSFPPEPDFYSPMQEAAPTAKTDEVELPMAAALDSCFDIQVAETAYVAETVAEAAVEEEAVSSEKITFKEEEDTEFLAVFEEAHEEVGEDVLPARWPETEELQTVAAAAIVPEGAPQVESLTQAEEMEPAGREGTFFEEGYIQAAVEDPLADLRSCVSSIGLELSDSIIKGLYTEINRLRSQAISRPIEKVFLQLLSTIAQHIDQYRYESSSEAFGLLQSVMDAFANSCEAANDLASQEALLTETTKVLLWQQGMLHRQAVVKGDELTFAVPVRSELAESLDNEEIRFVEEEEKDEFAAVFQGVEKDKAAEDEFAESASEDLFEAETPAYSLSEAGDQERLFAGVDVADDAAPGVEEVGNESLAGTEVEMAFEKEQDSYSVFDERKPDAEAAVAEELFFADLEADLAAERTAIIDDAHETVPFDQQLRDLIQSEFAQIRQEWQRDLEALRRELHGGGDRDSD